MAELGSFFFGGLQCSFNMLLPGVNHLPGK